MTHCKICGTDLSKDLFAYVAQKPVCAICTQKYVGGDFSSERIATVRIALGLSDGEFIKQDNAAEAARILGRKARA
jgi:hypothetical protein